ncbi:Outer membrane receptor proteins, mostly Fe transport [Chitinophaga sp. YR627]|nr:Outer membrane receptor proteins, mostly Fe transport [Chitinophaga sp. YR627]
MQIACNSLWDDRALQLKIYVLILSLLVIPLLSLSAQQRHLILLVKDKRDSTGIANATVILAGTAGNKLREGITGKDGVCLLDVTGAAKIHCEAADYVVYTSALSSYTNDTLVCWLNKKMVQLKSVDIVDKQVVSDAGKFVYKVRQDQFSKGQSGTELLAKLPGVIVVGEQVKLNGQTGVLILIDGKGEHRTSSQQQAILASLNADHLDKVEIMAMPSAKYDAGVNAVINVVTKKERGNSNVRASYSQPFYMTAKDAGFGYASGTGAANLNFKIRAVNCVWILSADNTLNTTQSAGWFETDKGFRYDDIRKSNLANFRISQDLNLDYAVNSRSGMGLNVNMRYVPSGMTHTIERYNFQKDSVTEVDNTNVREQRTIQSTLNYKYLLDTAKKSTLYISATWSVNPDDNRNTLLLQSAADAGSVSRNIISSNTDMLSASAIFSDVIKSRYLSTEFGIKSNHLRNNSDQQYDSSTWTNFHYNERISSAFFTARWKLGKWLMSTELRGELLRSDTRYKQTESEDQCIRRDYWKMYPNLLVQYNVKDALDLSLGYTKRVRRPFMGDMNPARRTTNAFMTQGGNIDFIPSYVDRIEGELMYKSSIVTLRYERLNNRRVFVPTADPFVYKATNMTRFETLGMSLSQALRLSKYFTSNITVDYSYSQYLQSGPFNGSTNVFEVSLDNEWTIGKKTRILISAYYNARMYLEYSMYNPLLVTSCSIKRILLKNKLFLQVSVSDPVGLEKVKSVSRFPGQAEAIDALTNNRRFSLQLLYSFPFGQKFKLQSYRTKNEGEIRTY